MTAPVPPAAIRGNDWRSLNPPPAEEFQPTIPITVVIPYYEAPEALTLTLAALERQTYPRELFEVVIVDDGSTIPLQAPESGFLAIRVFRRRDLGFGAARARNLGARMASHPILVFLDCDMLPEAGWLSAHARWHHTASDLFTQGFRAHVPMDGISATSIRDHRGTLAELLKGRTFDRPEWIEFYMARTRDLTSPADDIFRVVTSGNLGVSRSFFDQVGGFDGSFDRWGMEDTEFGYRAYTRGGPLVPVREAFCWHQGGRASPDAAKRESLHFQRAKVSHLIAHPDFRVAGQGRSFAVPRFVVTVDPLDRRPEVVHATVEEILADTVHDLVVWVGDRPDDPGYEWLRQSLEPDPRVFIDRTDGALGHFPNSPFHVSLPAGMACHPGLIGRLQEQLGASAAAVGGLIDGSRVSITRAWALHRSRRTGKDVGEVGGVVSLDTRGLAIHRDDGTPAPLAARSSFRSKGARVLRELSGIRSPRQAWVFFRWIITAVRLRLGSVTSRHRSRRLPGRGRRPGTAHRELRPAQYPLGVDMAVVGSKARSVFAASGRVHYSPGEGPHDLVLVETAGSEPDTGPWSRLPVVVLADAAPHLAVPAFDPEQVNPVDWVRHGGSKVGALGSGALLSPAIDIDTVVESSDCRTLSGLHHLEDTGAFHSGVTRRAATLASLAATGVLIHLNDTDADLEARLGTELYRLMQDERIPDADPGRRERISIRMRRAALRSHSLRARARQIAGEVCVRNHRGLPEVSIILPTKRPSMLARTLETVASQTYPRLELVLALHGDGFPDRIGRADLPVHVEVVRAPSERVFGAVLNQAGEAAGGSLLTKMDDDDHYDTEHIWDLVLAREFSKAELTAKGAEFVHLVDADRTIHRYRGGGEAYTDTLTIAGGAMLIARHDLVEAGGWRRVHTAVDQALATDVARIGGRVYRTHGHGYILVRHGDGHTWDAPDSYFLGQARDTRPGCDLAFAGIG